MAKKNSMSETEELKAAIADLQAKIEAKERKRENASEYEEESADSWISKEEEEVVEDNSDVDYDAIEREMLMQQEHKNHISETSVGEEEYVGENDSEEKSEADAEETDAKENLSGRKKRIIRETTEEDEDGPKKEDSKYKKNPKGRNSEIKHSVRRDRRKRGKTSEDDVIISLKNVSKSYVKGNLALSDVNIQIKRGEFVFIVGTSGSGKSTLVRLLLRELKPTSGSIMINGMQVEKLRRGKIPKLRRSMGVVFQDFRLLKDRNVYENVAFAQRIMQVPNREMKKNVPNMLAMVGLAGKYKANPTELSGGEQQRVAIARALVNEPPILIADEPTGNLDPQNTIEIMRLLEKINENGTTVIVVTHDDKMVDKMKKRVVALQKGVIISDEEKGGYSSED